MLSSYQNVAIVTSEAYGEAHLSFDEKINF